MYNQFTAAVAGTGFIGPAHVEGLKRLGVRVKGILGSTAEKSESARTALDLEKAYASFAEILADPEIDAVHVAVPNVLHFEMSKQALVAGKHVMCEKPLAMNATETAELVRVAESTGLVAATTYNQRFYPLNIESHARIKRGDLGDVIAVKGSYVQDWLLYETDYNWRVLAEQGGALRAVSDIGTHWIDLVCFITGLEVEAVFADLKTVHPVRKRPVGEIATFTGKGQEVGDTVDVPITTEDCGSVLFRFKGGSKGQLWVSQVTAGRKNAMKYEISGSQQSLTWNSEQPNQLLVGHRDQPNELLFKDPALIDGLTRHYVNYPGGHNEGYPSTFKQCFRAFYDAIKNGLSPSEAFYPTFLDGHKEVVLCDAILLSHREERWVRV